MSKFWIGEQGEEVITAILWLDKDGQCEEIYVEYAEDTIINLPGSMYKEDFPSWLKPYKKLKS